MTPVHGAISSLLRPRRLELAFYLSARYQGWNECGRAGRAQTVPPLSHRLHRALDTHLHADVVPGPDIPGQTTILQRDAIGVCKVDGLGPLVVDDFRDRDPFGQQLLALGLQCRDRACLKGKMIKGAWDAQPSVN